MTGQVLAWWVTGHWSWAVFWLIQCFGIFDQLYIVYANDYADRETDRENATATPFSGGSRVLVEGKLRASTLLKAAVAMAAGAVATTVVLGAIWGRWAAVPLGVVGLLLLWAYSFRPFRLSYRGGGELLQMIGVGGVLPLLGYYGQAGTFEGFPVWILATFMALNLSNAITTALPDRPSDRLSEKRTVPVWAGGAAARWLVSGLHVLGLVAFVVWGQGTMGFEVWTWVLLGACGVGVLGLAAMSAKARPGTPAIVAFVAISIAINLGWMVSVMVTLVG